ncbi:hypothetical protein Flexsi_2296 [Flexistipes sinusarabici DSM 4947]|uniref:Multi antimicrobial extrusion protein MatE n=3 Tax=Flexistipes sinusarabici TaxID=2352 RepID=F8E6M0_FLESM|nr:hypothetical protein [Flexistipes sinusarabici]AEI15910.1 hypothetical protein Flexsi_2296 [Flexistipes sinusarabici DSM 4947]
MSQTQTELKYSRIFVFWYPLALTWIMMSIEGPFLAAVIARMGEVKLNLAAYGIAYSFGLVVEAPIIMLMSASTTLVKNEFTYSKLKNFTIYINSFVTLFIVILIIPPVFDFVAYKILQIPEKIAEITHLATVFLIPWPAAIGFRRFYQGILIRSGLTRIVAYTTVFRLVFMGITAVTLFNITNLKGAYVGTIALSTGVIAEALAAYFLAQSSISEVKLNDNTIDSDLTYTKITKFYVPLALTPFIALSAQPIVTLFLAKSVRPIDSLAVMPVVHSLTFIFRSMGLSYQEVAITFLNENAKAYYKKIRNFAFIIAFGSTSAVFLLTATPLADLWFIKVSALTPDLADFAIIPAMIMSLLPALTVFISFERSVLVKDKITTPISVATLIEVMVIITSLFCFISFSTIPGAIVAAISFVIGRLFSNTFLYPIMNKSINRLIA